MPDLQASMKSFAAAAQPGTSWLIGCHRNPDADSLGSALALAVVLRTRGVNVELCVPDGVPPSLDFLPGTDTVQLASTSSHRFHGAVVLDLASKTLLHPDWPVDRVDGPVVVIDHHAYHDEFGDIIMRNVHAPATASVIRAWMAFMQLPITGPEVAIPLYAALLTDTGGFRHASTDADCLRFAAELVDAGALPSDVARRVFEEWSPARIPLLRHALDKLELRLDGRFALMALDAEVLGKLGVTPGMIEGLVDYGRSVAGVEVSAFLWEQPLPHDDSTSVHCDANSNAGTPHAPSKSPVHTRVSLRSTGRVNVAEIATHLGGGGHLFAAGATAVMPCSEVADRLETSVAQALRTLMP